MTVLPLSNTERDILRWSLEGRNTDVLAAFKAGAARSEIFHEAFVLAAGHRRVDTVQLLLDLGIDPEYRGRWGKSAVEVAVDHPAMVRLLLAAGASDTVNARARVTEASDGDLHLAARLGDPARCRAALARGASLESPSANGAGTALEIACRRSHVSVVIELLRYERRSGLTHREITKRRAFWSARRGPLTFEGWEPPPSRLRRLKAHVSRLVILAILAQHYTSELPADSLPIQIARPPPWRAEIDEVLLTIVEEWRAEIRARSAGRRPKNIP